MHLRRVMEVNDRALDDLVVGNVEINGVVGAQPRRTPVDLSDLAVSVANLQPVADFVWSVNLQRHSGDDSAEQILAGDAEDDHSDARTGEQTLQLTFRVIADAEHQEQRDQKDQCAEYLAQKMRDRKSV